jgi:O-antigen/teichoic acid export membrane protein
VQSYAFSLIGWLPPGLQGRMRTAWMRAGAHGFARNVAVMLTGTVAGQAVSLALSPVLTRLFSPAEFGQLGVYSSALMILAMIASLGLEQAIPICLDEADCANLLVLCGIVLAGVTTCAGLVLWLIPAEAFHTIGLGPLAHDRYLLPLGLLWLGGYYVLLSVATRAGAYSEIARTRLSQGISGPVSQIGFGLLGAGSPGLVIGFIVGQASGTLLLLRRFVLERRTWLAAVSWRGIAAIWRRYGDFPLYSSWARLLDRAGGGDVIEVLFATCYSPTVAGFMFLSDRVIVRPLLIVSTSLLQVFTGEAGRAVSQEPELLRRRFWQMLPLQFLLAAGWILAANLAAGWVFPRLFGAAWADAIPYLRALSLSYLVQMVLHPVSTTLQVLEHQRAAAIWQVSRLVLVVASVLLPWQAGLSALTALWISSIAQAVCCLVLAGMMAVSLERLTRRA